MKTPPTIPAPLPTDHRLLRLADLLKVSRRDALGATVDAWAWIAAQATGGIVPQPVVLLDSVAESCDKWGPHEEMIATISIDSRIAVLAFLSLRRMVAQHTVNRLERHVGMGAN